MNNAYKLLCEYMCCRAVDFVSVEEEKIVRFTAEGSRFISEVVIAISGGLMALCAVIPLKVPQNRLKAIAEYLMRVNAEIPIGSFLVLFKDKKVNFCIAVPIDEESITKDQMAFAVQMMMGHTMAAINRMSTSFVKAAFTNTRPSTAVEMMNQKNVKCISLGESQLTDIESIHQN